MIMKKIAICVCTCQRPQMLFRCLASLRKLDHVHDVDVEIIVIDNEERPSRKAEYAAVFHDANYWHEPRRGIPQARNAALDVARKIGATHVAFIDDDEVATESWLVELCAAMDRYRADAVQGFVLYEYPSDSQKWRRRGEYNFKKQVTGEQLGIGTTGNVLFRLSSAEGLRFDESLRFLGGEDIVFFDAFVKNGGKIVFCKDAQTIETVPWSRLTIQAQTRKAYRKGYCRISEARLTGSPIDTSIWKLAKRGVTGSLKLGVSPLCFVWPPLGLHIVMSGCRNLAFTAGSLAALAGMRSNDYYANPTGY
jgi:succinoglycan biosynthesis protein ExoM